MTFDNVRKVLTLLSLISGGMLTASTHDNHTFLMPRSVGMNKVMEHTRWDSFLHNYCDVNHLKSFHTRMTVTPFFQKSTNGKELGKYFGVNGKSSFTIGERYNVDGDADLELADESIDVDANYFTGIDTDDDFATRTVHLNPEQTVWGTRLDLEYAHNPHKGFFARVGLPFASVSNHMHMKMDNDAAVTIGGKSVTFADILAGKMTITDDSENLRTGLQKSKIAGRNSVAGLADLEIALGYRNHHQGDRHVATMLKVLVPTGNSVRGENLFEAVCGNGGHFGIGFNVDGGVQLWKNLINDHSLWLETGVNYVYLFAAKEVRMVGVKGFDLPPLATYMQMSEINPQGASAPKPFFHAADQLTRDVMVMPGNAFDATLDLSYRTSSFSFDLGYNFFWRSHEQVEVCSWENDKYGIMNPSSTEQAITSALDFVGNRTINREHLDTSAAETPHQVTHKIHTGISYHMAGDCCAGFLGLGGSFEVATANSALDQYAVWLKGSLAW